MNTSGYRHRRFTPRPSERVQTDNQTVTVQVTIRHKGTFDLDVLKRLIQGRHEVTDIKRVDESAIVTK